jgi:hypothetical protein
MTNETRIAIGEGGRGLVLGLVLEDKDASEKLKTQTDSLSPQSDSQYDSQYDSQSDSPPNSDPQSTTPEERLVHLAKTYSADKGTADLNMTTSDTVIMPRKLTAENGAKAALIGEFNIPFPVVCSACAYDGAQHDCEVCGGTIEYTQTVNVPWTVIKEIYAAAVKHFHPLTTHKG